MLLGCGEGEDRRAWGRRGGDTDAPRGWHENATEAAWRPRGGGAEAARIHHGDYVGAPRGRRKNATRAPQEYRKSVLSVARNEE